MLLGTRGHKQALNGETDMSRPWTALRVAVLIAAALGILFTLGSLWRWWRIPDSHRDGLELIGLAAGETALPDRNPIPFQDREMGHSAAAASAAPAASSLAGALTAARPSRRW